jgi:hypothetical protein
VSVAQECPAATQELNLIESGLTTLMDKLDRAADEEQLVQLGHAYNPQLTCLFPTFTAIDGQIPEMLRLHQQQQPSN